MKPNAYVSVDITGKETILKTKVTNYVNGLSNIKDADLHGAVDYVMTHLPSGLSRVDGLVIEPIFKEVIVELTPEPEPEPEEE